MNMIKNYARILLLLVFSVSLSKVFGDRDLCRLNCTSEKCKTAEGFMLCVRTCQQSITPLMRQCVRAGLASGFKIPQELVENYEQVIPMEHRSRHTNQQSTQEAAKKESAVIFPGQLQRSMLTSKTQESIRAMAMWSRKNLVERCRATKERVSYFADLIKGTMFEGLLSDIVYRVDVLFSHVYESPVVDAIFIDNAAECRAMGTAVEGIIGKVVNSPGFKEHKIKFAKDKKFGRKKNGYSYRLGKEGIVPHGPPIKVPSIASNQAKSHAREILRPDILAQLKNELREEVYRELKAKRDRMQEQVNDDELDLRLSQRQKPYVLKPERKSQPKQVDLDERW